MEPSIKDVLKTPFLEFIQGYSQITIPSFQRPYTWKPKQLTDLWDSITSNKSYYYIGTIFCIPGSSKNLDSNIEIIDGQQRVTTISLIVLAIRDYLNKNGEVIKNSSDLIGDLDELLIYKPKFRSSDREPRSKLTFWKENLNEFYSDLIFKNIFDSSTLDENQKRILSNYKKAQSLVKDFLKNENDKTKKIDELISKIQTLYIIVIVAKDDVNAFQLFEGLNSTGIPLSEVDLIKNAILKTVYQLAKSPGDKKLVDKAENLWLLMESGFEENSIVWFSKYLRHHWISKNGYVGASALFSVVKEKELSNKNDIKEIVYYLQTLVDESGLYNALRNADLVQLNKEKYIKQLSARNKIELHKILFRLKMYGVQQIYEVLLALTRKFYSDEKYTEAKFLLDLKRLASFSVLAKYTSVVPSKYEKLFAEMCVLANEKSTEKDPHIVIIKELRLLVCDRDLEFSSAFSDEVKYKNDSDTRRFLYDILYEIYKFEYPPKQKIKFEEDSLEHLIAQTPSSESSLTKDDIKEYVHKIGNLTIVDRATNGKMQNIEFEKKVNYLSEDILESNRKIINYQKDFVTDPASAIDARGKELGKVFYELALAELNKG